MKNLISCAVYALLAWGVPYVQAAVVSESFTASVVAGVFTGQLGAGSFSYEDGFLSGSGREELKIDSGLIGVELTLFGQTFRETDDLGFPEFPILIFADGTVVELNFALSEPGVNILMEGVIEISMNELFFGGSGGLEAEIAIIAEVSEVPLPPAFWLFASTLLGIRITKIRLKTDFFLKV